AADGASYAVIIAIFSRPLAETRAGTETGEVSERLAMSRSFPPGRRPEKPDRRRKGRTGIIRLGTDAASSLRRGGTPRTPSPPRSGERVGVRGKSERRTSE